MVQITRRNLVLAKTETTYGDKERVIFSLKNALILIEGNNDNEKMAEQRILEAIEWMRK